MIAIPRVRLRAAQNKSNMTESMPTHVIGTNRRPGLTTTHKLRIYTDKLVC